MNIPFIAVHITEVKANLSKSGGQAYTYLHIQAKKIGLCICKAQNQDDGDVDPVSAFEMFCEISHLGIYTASLDTSKRRSVLCSVPISSHRQQQQHTKM